MAAIIKEEIFTTIKKKRFIILTALLFAGAIASMIYTKTDYFNDMTCLFAMLKYMTNVFDPLAGTILLFSVYRRRYTNSSITQAEEHGAKRSTAVTARAAAGSIILAASYALLALLMLITALILGANLSSAQTGMFLAELLSDCIAAVTIYVGVLFWLYLFAFPLVPMALYAALMLIPNIIFIENDIVDNMIFKVCAYILPESGMNAFAAGLIYGNPQWIYLLICIGYIVLTLLLTILVFKLKKFKVKKGGEVTDGEAQAPTEATREVQAAPAGEIENTGKEST